MKPVISILSAILIAVLNLSGAATYSYNGNISSRSFDGKRYDYFYDSHNRLTEARFSDSGKDFSARYTYDCRANITSLVRKGIVDKVGTAETYGTLDSLAISYSGNLISGITARSGALPFEGMTGLGRNGDFIDFAYDGSGRLYQDSSRGISDIIYDNDGNRTQTITENGNIYDYYDGAGNHLRTEYSENGKPTVVREYTGAGHIITDSVVTRTPCPGGYFSGRGGYPLYYLTDWQGNNIATLNALGATVSSHRYYPYGEPWREPSREEFLFSGNERIRYDGINDYDFHARRYNAAVPRFDKQDIRNGEYPWLSPYAYCAGNPIRYTDHFGEKIRVPKEYQENFEKDLNAVFGDKSKEFYFDDDGILQYNGTEKELTDGMSKDQKKAFKGLKKVMKNKETTDVVYENEYEFSSEEGKKNIKDEYGGGAYSPTENTIVIAPDADKIITVRLDLEEAQKRKKWKVEIEQNSTSLLFHEIGERITSDKTYRGGAIDYENVVRGIIGLSTRPYDINHKKKPLMSY